VVRAGLSRPASAGRDARDAGGRRRQNAELPPQALNTTARFSGLWRHRDFHSLWTGQIISVFGSLTTRLALPFTAILFLQARPHEVAFVTSADVLAGICVALFAGVWVDRLRRRPIMIAADIGRAAIIAWVPIAAWYGVLRIEHLYVVAFLAGILTTFFDVAYHSYLPTLIGRDQLMEGNSKLTASESVAEFGSFSVSGWLVQLVTAPGAMAIDALSFLVSAASLLVIRAPEPTPPVAAERRGVGHEIGEGMRALWNDAALRALALSRVAFAAATGMFGAVILLFVSRDLGFSPGAQGMIYGIGGLTSLAAATGAARCRERFGAGRSMIGGLVAGALGLMLIVAAPRRGALGVVMLVTQQIVSDPGWAIYTINETTMRQDIAPETVLGRVTAADRFGSLVATLVATIMAGLIADLAGSRVVLAAGACCMFVAALVIFVSPIRHRR
jgi:MFS family permease